MSAITVAESSSVSFQAHQDAAEKRGQETANRAAERASGAADNPAVYISASSLAQRAADLSLRLDEMARAADISAKEALAREAELSRVNEAARHSVADEAAAREEDTARVLAEQTAAQLVQDKLSMTTRTDRNILQYLTG